VVAKTRITKKQLKKPDEFVSWGSQALDYSLTHLKYIVLGVLLSTAIIVSLVIWKQHETASEEVAHTLLVKGIVLFHEEQSREEALSTFSHVIADYPRTKATEVALLYRGRCYLLKNDPERAIDDFKIALNKSSLPEFRVIALNSLGNSYWAQEKYQEAIDYFQQVITSGDEWMKPYVLRDIGMCWEKLGDKKKAADAYQEALKNELPSPWNTLVKTRLSKLGKIE
jgi:tetratricopeptide (TPR) repeat protein